MTSTRWTGACITLHFQFNLINYYCSHGLFCSAIYWGRGEDAPFLGQGITDTIVWAEIRCPLIKIDEYFFAEEQDIYKVIDVGPSLLLLPVSAEARSRYKCKPAILKPLNARKTTYIRDLLLRGCWSGPHHVLLTP